MHRTAIGLGACPSNATGCAERSRGCEPGARFSLLRRSSGYGSSVVAALPALAPALARLARRHYSDRLLAVLLAIGLGVAPFGRAATERPGPLREVGFDQHLGASVPPDLPFRDETGTAIRLGDLLRDRPVLLVPAYFDCPMLCTLVLNGVVSALRPLAFDAGREFDVVVFSFDPRDGAPLAAAKKATLLRVYDRPGTEGGWRFLTGDAAAIETLTRTIGFRYTWDDAGKQFAHAGGMVLVTPGGQVARYFFGVEFSPRDLRLAIVEAASERIGSLVDQLLLFCFHWDPHTGRYSATVLGVIRLVGVATLLALVTFVVRSARTVAS